MNLVVTPDSMQGLRFKLEQHIIGMLKQKNPNLELDNNNPSQGDIPEISLDLPSISEADL